MENQLPTDNGAAIPEVSPSAHGSVRFSGHLDEHSLHAAIAECCQEIEKLPPSDQQTRCVEMVGRLQHQVATLRAVAAREADTLRIWAEDTFPANENGQVHFARALMEGVADDLDDEINPKRDRSIEAKRGLLVKLRERTAQNTSDQTPRVEPQ
jgi:hypothetical protein